MRVIMINKAVDKRKIFIVATCFFLIFSIVFSITSKESLAASLGYFSTYKNIAQIEHGNYYSSSQGMSIYGSKAYYIKTKNTKDYKTEPTQIWTLDMNTGYKKLVYNNDNKSNIFKIGHANSIYVNSKYMYIATQLKNKASIYRYNVYWKNGKCSMSNLKKYKVYTSRTDKTKLLSVTGIEYAKELGGFLIKNGMKVYLGNFSTNEFVWTKCFNLGTKLSVVTKSGRENLDFGNGKFIMQGLYYKNGYIYMPMTNANKMWQSAVVAYPIKSTVKSGTTINPTNSHFVRITSKTYKKLFEIEEVSLYNGQMYANVNAIDNNGKNSDRIIRINNFYY